MGTYEEKLEDFAIDLFKINAIKFGEYKTKIGLMTPVYCDLRVLVSHPKVMATLSELIVSTIKDRKDINVICGVPYTALPIATMVSHKTNIPMVMRRKEAKDYGTKKLIEGAFEAGDKCLIIEDVVTSGSSILETTKDLVEEGLKVSEAIVLLNREQGGEKFLLERGIKMHALLTMTKLMKILKKAKCVDLNTYTNVIEYFKCNQVDAQVMKKNQRIEYNWENRLKHVKNPPTIKLVNIIMQKKSNLCVAADLTDAKEILQLAQNVGPYICLLKLHVDIMENFDDKFIESLKSIAESNNFLLMEDRKFADIGYTSELQFTKGVFKICRWAHFVTAHSLTGNGFLEYLKEHYHDVGVFLLAECSAKGSLIDDKYVKATVKLGTEYRQLMAGFVCQNKLFTDEPGFLQLTPGVNMGEKGDSLGQQYNSPQLVMENGADIAVVGRGITRSKDPAKTAQNYRDLLWMHFHERIGHQ